MSEKYNRYLEEHKNNVRQAFEWLEKNLPEIFGSEDEEIITACRHQCTYAHDESKLQPDEYEPYDTYFYGNNKSYEVVDQFNRAWLKHIHRNPHHWQHWVLINDDSKLGEIILDMPDVYIIEMICDWWSFSWKNNNLDEIFNWYEERRAHMKLSDYTRTKVEEILNKMKDKLHPYNKED